MDIDINGNKKVRFDEGTLVEFNLGSVRGLGKIRGLASVGLVD